MTEATVELERLGKIARLTLCNPMNRNAITEHMRDTMYLGAWVSICQRDDRLADG